MTQERSRRVEEVIKEFTRRQDANMAELRTVLVDAGCSDERLREFDAIALQVRSRVVENMPGYIASIGAMIERDVTDAPTH